MYDYVIHSILLMHVMHISVHNQIICDIKKVLRKHSLHGENSSLGFIKAVNQW